VQCIYKKNIKVKINLCYYFDIQQVQFSFCCILQVCTLGHNKLLPLSVVIVAVYKSRTTVNFLSYYENVSVLLSEDLCSFGINFQIGLERMRMRRM